MKKLVFLLMVMVSFPTMARQFDIEVIIFKRNVAPETINESWPDKLPAIDYTDTKVYADFTGVRKLPSSSYRLKRQYEALQNHAGFTPLFHAAWRQGDWSSRRAPVFHIQAGQNFASQFNPDGTPIEPGQVVSTTPLYELEGTLQVYVQHYLFTKVNLDLRKPGQREVVIGADIEQPVEAVEDGTESDAVVVGQLQQIEKQVEVESFLKTFRMQQLRKMGSGEIHYLDHPLMGMLIYVRKLD
ncbi:hypothetical protein VST7929_01665 [Vibrio stylophorae]|uniref:Peptidoglycan-binding protein CsiV n=1 Tax=Vibrio stylophorae TaxID=659351 RepID=A0ABM8ZTZ5_9VIBR|nr:peptidoglycan binding protein CsiV [Vibrio stylophorae]CAH0533790.1 hypothetical protein VST7929_01665 [Vibrio stylophorae]